jgi:IS5 family transposase
MTEPTAGCPITVAAEMCRAVRVEGVFGTDKRRYSLNLILAKPKAGAEGITSRSFLVTCTEKNTIIN